MRDESERPQMASMISSTGKVSDEDIWFFVNNSN